MNAFHVFANHLERRQLSRRDVLWLMGAGAVSASVSGCSTSPVTGKSILVGMSESQEKSIDKKISPQQFSQDLGPIQDSTVNTYVGDLGQKLDAQTHRPDMPYSYRVLNANYVNAYTFPGGAMGVTRGILVNLKDESELAALLGHELGHVNARHAAQRQGQSMIAQAALAGLSIAAQDSPWSSMIGIGGQVGASALLASYSRDNEREADALGQSYMVKAGYPASGMARLHQLLIQEEKETPGLLQTMFSSHPMSRERYDTAEYAARTEFAHSLSANPQKERFMDSTASLRQLKSTIEACQKGELDMAKKKLDPAHAHFQQALKQHPRDYAANLRMAQCLQAQGKVADAGKYAEQARHIYPTEAQAHKVSAIIALDQRDPGRAFSLLEQYDRMLPGDTGVVFLKGISLEGMGRRDAAAQHYATFLKQGNQGQAGQYAYGRLKTWGYAK